MGENDITGTYSCAIRIPADHEVAGGATLYAERIWLSYDANISNMKIWISKQLPATADEADILCDAVTLTKGGCVDFAFSQPYTITTDSVYVGYSFNIDAIESDDDRWPVVTSIGEDDIRYAMYIRFPGYSYWMSNTGSLEGWGNLAMHVLLGDNYYNNALSVVSASNVTVAKDGTAQTTVTLKDEGGSTIDSFSFTTTVDGVESEPVRADIIGSPFYQVGMEQTFHLPVPASSQVGVSEVKVTITKVNDEPNEISDGRQTGSLLLTTVAEASPRKTVMENYVKTIDNLSPLALVGNDRLTQYHPDNYIGIMIHDQDVMATGLYNETCVTLTNPWIWAHINRQGWTYQYYGSQYFGDAARTKFGIEDDFQDSQSEVVEAAVKVTAEWTDESRNTLTCQAQTTFQFSTSDADYALAFVITEDGMHGSGDEWLQANVLYVTQNGHMFDWDEEVTDKYVYGGEWIGDMYYNDVLVAGEGIYGGVEGSISLPIECSETQSYQHQLSIAGNTLIQDRDSLELTVMLLDNKGGRIVNADRCKIAAAGSQSISTIADEKQSTVAYYTLDGKPLSAPRHGLVLVRKADGTLDKQFLNNK